MDRAVAALQDLTRRDILYRFYSNPAPKTAIEVAKSAGIHRSVAFDHLERLVALGYLVSERRRGFPGKPANLYRLAQGPITVSHPPRQFGLLAQYLALAMEEFGPAGRAAARRGGERLAANLDLIGAADTVASCIQPLEALGGRYDTSRPGEIVARNCLFREACEKSPVVCEFHAGLLGTLLEPAKPGVRIEASGKDGSSGCRYRFEPLQAERMSERQAAS